MKHKTSWIFFFGIGLSLLLSTTACKEMNEEQKAELSLSKSSQIIKEVGNAYWNNMIEESLSLRMKYGNKIEKLPDISLKHAQSQSALSKSWLEKLILVDSQTISHDEWISLEILKWKFEASIDNINYYWLKFPITPNASPLPSIHRAFRTYKFEENGDLEDYLNLLKQYPGLIEAILNKTKRQLEKNIVLPKDELDLVVPFLKAYIQKGKKSLFYVNKKRLENYAAPEIIDFQQKLLKTIDSEVNPALSRLVGYVKGAYSKKAVNHVGLWQYPGGSAYYDYLIKFYTTLNLTPEEIHDIGLRHIEINDEGIDKIRKSVGFKGSLAEFKHFLESDPRFFPKTAEEIGEKLQSFMGGMCEQINRYFLKKPKAQWAIERLAPELEESMTFGYTKSPTAADPRGIYYYNGSKPEERSLLQSESLIYHELIPGHHFQGSLQSENRNLPNFRRETHFCAYSEGWAEYAAWLGLEMGLYKNPYDLCGRYLSDTFLAARLVVDTGMNYFKWPRDEAVIFMKDNTTFSETQIYTESLRYSVGKPGQALAYKLGSIKMAELRKKAERALGAKFDIRKYHDAILGSGSMPLPILEKHIDWFINRELSGAGS